MERFVKKNCEKCFFLSKKEKLLIVQNDKVTLTKLEKGGIFPSLTVMFGKTPQKGLFYIAFPAVLFRFVINS